jgi:hypothetical protein
MLGGTGSGAATSGAYKHNTTTGENEIIHVSTDPNILKSVAFCSDDSANVIGGFDQDNGGNFTPTIWTPQLGWANFVDFLNAQGSYLQGTFPAGIQKISANGQVWVGVSGTSQGLVPFRVEIPTVIVCHKAQGNPHGKEQDLAVSFPGGLNDHLAHGDSVGLCQDGNQ